MSIEGGAGSWLAGGGEMAAHIRAYDWSGTPLGPIDGWPQSLKICVRIMMASRLAMWLGWGDELIGLYNDSFREIIGNNHPAALGRPAATAWPGVWAANGPRTVKVLHTGEGTYEAAVPITFERRGQQEEGYYTLSKIPVAGDDGATVGVLTCVTDETARVTGERQLALLHELASRAADSPSIEEACRRSAEAIATNPKDLPFALLYATDDARRSASLLGRAGIDLGATAPATIDLTRPSVWPIAESLHASGLRVVGDESASAAVVPIAPLRSRGPAIVLVAGLNPHRRFDACYRKLLALVAGQIGASIQHALTHEAERRRADTADRARSRLFGFFAQSPIGIGIMRGPELRFEFANREFERVNGRHDIVGKTIREVFLDIPADSPSWGLFERVYHTGEPFVASEYRQDRDLGNGLETTYWTYNIHPLRDEHGVVDAVMVSGVNVSDIVRARDVVEAARADAEKANREKDEFLAMLGHELRNPLTPILATLGALRMRGSRSLLRERRLLERQARQLADTVDDLLDVSRIAAGKITLSRHLVELADIVGKSMEASTPLLDERAHQVRVDVPRGLVIDGDQRRLVQVVSNLLDNAAKYTGVGGRIEVVAGREGELAVLRVRDSGIGISADLLPTIFDRFTQSERSRDCAPGGLGLGLSIVRSVVQLHGGVVEVHSDGPGRGSEFTVRLPRERSRRTRRRADAAPPSRATVTRTILIVDDNRDVADVLARVLRRRGHAVEVAHDGPTALECVRHFSPDVALLDLGLPKMDGYQLARRLRKQRGLAKLDLLAISGYGQASDVERARQAGFASHMAKPIDVERLVAMLERR